MRRGDAGVTDAKMWQAERAATTEVMAADPTASLSQRPTARDYQGFNSVSSVSSLIKYYLTVPSYRCVLWRLLCDAAAD